MTAALHAMAPTFALRLLLAGLLGFLIGLDREYRAKEKEARKLARQADDPMEQLRLKKEARKWEQRAEEADEDFRDTRKKLRAEADKYLELIEQSLQGTQETEHLFTIRWRIAT